MSHRPMTNTSSLKIAAAYCPVSYAGCPASTKTPWLASMSFTSFSSLSNFPNLLLFDHIEFIVPYLQKTSYVGRYCTVLMSVSCFHFPFPYCCKYFGIFTYHWPVHLFLVWILYCFDKLTHTQGGCSPSGR